MPGHGRPRQPVDVEREPAPRGLDQTCGVGAFGMQEAPTPRSVPISAICAANDAAVGLVQQPAKVFRKLVEPGDRDLDQVEAASPNRS